MPFNPFAGQPADTHRGRPRKKEPEPTQTEPEVPVEAPAETESSWEAAWGGTASVEPKPEPPMEADGPTGVPVEPEPPAETPATGVDPGGTGFAGRVRRRFRATG